MSFTAYVAFQSDNGYRIHRSHNGGENYLLKPILDDMVEEGIDIIEADLPKVFTAAVKDMISPSEESYLPEDSGDLITEDPVHVGVDKREICSAIPVFETEALYVVEDDTVKTFVPVNPSPTAIDAVSRMLHLNIYKVRQDETPPQALRNPARTPDISIGGDEFNPVTVQNLPRWGQEVIEQAHRYMANNCKKLNSQGPSSQITTVLNDVLVVMQLVHEDAHYPLINVGIPIKVDFNDNGEPSYPMQFHKNSALGALPKIATSKLRWELYPHYYKVVENMDVMGTMANPEDNTPDEMINIIEKMHSEIAKNFGDDLATDYIPEELNDLLYELSTNDSGQ